MRLIYTETKKAVAIGDIVFIDGKNDTVESFPAPHKPASSGRVYLGSGASYYVSIIGAQWVEREDHIDAAACPVIRKG